MRLGGIPKKVWDFLAQRRNVWNLRHRLRHCCMPLGVSPFKCPCHTCGQRRQGFLNLIPSPFSNLLEPGISFSYFPGLLFPILHIQSRLL